jgi:hypothetical protein
MQLRGKRRRFDFSGPEPELQIDVELCATEGALMLARNGGKDRAANGMLDPRT